MMRLACWRPITRKRLKSVQLLLQSMALLTLEICSCQFAPLALEPLAHFFSTNISHWPQWPLFPGSYYENFILTLDCILWRVQKCVNKSQAGMHVSICSKRKSPPCYPTQCQSQGQLRKDEMKVNQSSFWSSFTKWDFFRTIIEGTTSAAAH